MDFHPLFWYPNVHTATITVTFKEINLETKKSETVNKQMFYSNLVAHGYRRRTGWIVVKVWQNAFDTDNLSCDDADNDDDQSIMLQNTDDRNMTIHEQEGQNHQLWDF